jgi:hypothetical protein
VSRRAWVITLLAALAVSGRTCGARTRSSRVGEILSPKGTRAYA